MPWRVNSFAFFCSSELCSRRDDGGGELARDFGWFLRLPQVGEPRSTGAPDRSLEASPNRIRMPSSLVKISSLSCSPVGLSGGVMLPWKRLGCRFRGSVRFFALRIGLFSDEVERRGGVPGRLKWIVFGRNREAMKTVMMGYHNRKVGIKLG